MCAASLNNFSADPWSILFPEIRVSRYIFINKVWQRPWGVVALVFWSMSLPISLSYTLHTDLQCFCTGRRRSVGYHSLCSGKFPCLTTVHWLFHPVVFPACRPFSLMTDTTLFHPSLPPASPAFPFFSLLSLPPPSDPWLASSSYPFILPQCLKS